MRISGVTAGLTTPMYPTSVNTVQKQAPVNADMKLEAPRPEKQEEPIQKVEETNNRRMQDEQKEQMDLQERSSAAMGFGSKVQMELIFS